MPNTIKVIDNYAFNECSKLENITLPSELTEIGVDAFYECTGLQNITIPSKVENIKEEAFLKSKTTVYFNKYSKISEFGDYAFGTCTINDSDASNHLLSLNDKALTDPHMGAGLRTDLPGYYFGFTLGNVTNTGATEHDTSEIGYDRVTKTGKAGISFEYCEPAMKIVQEPSNIVADGGWRSFAIRKTLNATFYFKSEVRRQIKNVKKYYATKYKDIVIKAEVIGL